MTLDTANERQVKAAQKAVKRRNALNDEAVRWMMGDIKGRGYLAELVRDSQALLNVVAAGEQGAMFREGRKVLGLKIMADVQRVCPAQFPGLIQAVFADPPKDEKTDGNGTDTSDPSDE